jgi:class 3 adenylate cyclase
MQDDSTSPEPLPLFCGLRAKVGIYSGRVDRVLPHGKIGRADYLGPPANRAARLMSAALGGQVGWWAGPAACWVMCLTGGCWLCS